MSIISNVQSSGILLSLCVFVKNFRDELSTWKYSHISNFVSFEEFILLDAVKYGAHVFIIGGRDIRGSLTIASSGSNSVLVIVEAAAVLLAL